MGIEGGPFVPEAEQADARQDTVTVPHRGLSKKRALLLGSGLSGIMALGGTYWANEHPDKAAELSRRLIGDERTAQLEGIALSIKDEKDQLWYELFGGRENPFDDTFTPIIATTPDPVPQMQGLPPTDTFQVPSQDRIFSDPYEFLFPPEPQKPKPMTLPETTLIQSEAAEGEGVWVIDGLPRTSVDDVLMAKTYIRPDKERPYASVGVLLLDKRRVKLNMVGGKSDPPRYGSIKPGPGTIPEEDIPNLLTAFNGGFQLAHGDAWGMYANGIEYQGMKNGYASVVIMKDGTIKMGTWGEGELAEKTEEMLAIRQNCVLLVDNGEVTPAAKNQGTNNNVWGYVQVNAAEFITWRSAIGLTKEGDFLVAAGNSLSAKNLAEALKAAGAHTAMQLDINNPYVQIDLFFHQEDGGIITSLFMETMPDKNSRRYLKPQNRDFMYITLDETRFKP